MIEDKYVGKLDNQDIRWFDYLIKSKGSCPAALNSLLHDLNCTRVYPDGSRPVMSINYGYRRDIAGYFYVLEKLKNVNEETANFYLDKLIVRHEENLNFEKDNPPINYQTKQRRSSGNITRTAKIKDMFTGEEASVDVGSGKVIRPKENAATRKAKALADRTVSFAFNNFKVSK